MKSLTITLLTCCILGFAYNAVSQVTNWNAYNDFYFDSTNYANHSPDSTPPFPTLPSHAGSAWGYYDCNANGYGGYPTNIGSYFGPGGNTAAGQVLLAMDGYQPLGSGQGQIAGNVPGSGDSWDATGGSGWAAYRDANGWGSSVGEYGGAWYPGAPGFGTPYANATGLYLQPGFLGVPFSDGIGNVVTWTAPDDATYVFSGSFLIANNNPGNHYAVVDSLGGIEVPLTAGVSGTYNTFSFTNTYHAGDVVEFQIGTGGQAAAAVGFNCNIGEVHITDWNAYGDFYFDSTNYQNNSVGTVPPYPTFPSATGSAWGYYDCNVNGVSGYPSTIGSYFGPGANVSMGQVLNAMANDQPLGPGNAQVGGGLPGSTDAWDEIGGSGLARYGDNQGWGTDIGEFGYAWFPGAPGYGTPYSTQGGIYLVPGYLGNASAEGIGNVVSWTAPAAATYTFNGYFLIAGNNPGNDYAVVDSTGGVEIPRTVGAPSTYNSFSFQKAFNAGDVVEFQVGSDIQAPAYVGFNCVISSTPVPAVLVSASRSITNSAQVAVKFNAPIYAPSVANLANYSIPGTTITSAALSPSDPTTIILTVNPGLNASATLTLNGIENDYGQLPVAANSMALISVPVYVPAEIGVPVAAAQDTFTGSGLSTNWQSGAVNDDETQSNYVFSQVFVQSNGVLHVHANNLSTTPANYWDPNYLLYVNPAYEGTDEGVLIHMTIKASNFSPTGPAGVAVGVSPDPYVSLPEGGDCIRTVPAGYASSTNEYPFFMSCSDFIADEPVASGTNEDEYNMAWRVGGSYWLRIQQTTDTNPATSGNPGGIISVKAWPGDGSAPEPANWQLTWKDPLPGGYSTRSGYAAIRAGYGSGTVMDFDVDYFLVSAPGLPTITPTLPSNLVPQIALNIAIGGGNAVVSWPAAVQSSFQLQTRTSLTSGNWSNVNTAVVVNGLENTVSVSLIGQQNQFFRLVQTQ